MWHTLTRWTVGALITLVGAFALPSQALAQSAPDAYVVTVRDSVTMRCRAGTIWYEIAQLDAGQVLRVAGEREGWLAVEYPPGTPAVSRIERVEVRDDEAGGQVAVLTRASTLFAYNMGEPTRDTSYAAVFATNKLDAGTQLEIIGPIDRRGGGLGGYLVLPPRGAIGYVQPVASDVRTATQDEIDAFLRESGWGEPATDDDAAEDDGDSGQATDDDSMAEDAGTTDGGLDGADDTDAADNAASGDDGDTDSETPDAGIEETPMDAYERAERTLESLDDAFRRVVDAPLEEAEVIGLIDAYRDLGMSLPNDQVSDTFREAIAARVELLQIRQDLQKVLRDAAALDAEVRTTPDAQAVTRSASLGYEAVGRLLPSLIYDGDRLPRLYRIVSVDGAAGRTIAYVAPVEGISMESRVGSIVGVHGSATTEQDRSVPILRPDVVDVLRIGG